jgi:hypothetical protein
MLSDDQIAVLKLASRKQDDPDLGKPNPVLDDAIKKIQDESPHLFWQQWELKKRNFYDEPAFLSAFDYNSFVRPSPAKLAKLAFQGESK